LKKKASLASYTADTPHPVASEPWVSLEAGAKVVIIFYTQNFFPFFLHITSFLTSKKRLHPTLAHPKPPATTRKTRLQNLKTCPLISKPCRQKTNLWV